MRYLLPLVLAIGLGCMGGVDTSPGTEDTSAPPPADPDLPVDGAPQDGEGGEDDGVVEATADTGNDDGEAVEGEDPAPPVRRRRRRRRPGGPPPKGRPSGGKPPATAPKPQPAPVPAPAPPVEDQKPSGPPSARPPGITQVNDTTWHVTEANVERWKEDPYILSSVHQEDVGWSLVYARKREAWHLGMRNKDVILEVNGKKLNSKAQLVAAYLALKNKKEFDVLFERKGKKRTHHYVVK